MSEQTESVMQARAESAWKVRVVEHRTGGNSYGYIYVLAKSREAAEAVGVRAANELGMIPDRTVSAEHAFDVWVPDDAEAKP